MSSISNPAQVEPAYEKALKPAVVRWTMPGWCSATTFNQAILANRIYYMPIFIPERTTYDRIGIFVQAGDGAGGLCDLRIFNFEGGLPTSQVLSAGTVPTNGAGAQEIIINQTLERGYYFLALRDDQAPTLTAQTNNMPKSPVPGLSLTNAAGAVPNSI
ncbi:unnamed protein product, partial [marine sediment metagenome]